VLHERHKLVSRCLRSRSLRTRKLANLIDQVLHAIRDLIGYIVKLTKLVIKNTHVPLQSLYFALQQLKLVAAWIIPDMDM
jgi:hypothetical protein